MPQTVLVIEDDEMIRECIYEILAAAGYVAAQASSGRAGLDQLAVQRPALVLCDFHMPGFTGLDVLKAMRAEPATREIPLVVITADASADARKRAVFLGADGYLLKPFNAAQLLATVRAAIGRSATA